MKKPGLSSTTSRYRLIDTMISPLRPRVLVVGIIYALFCVSLIFVTAEDTSSPQTADIASAYGLIGLLSIVFGSWLASAVVGITIRLILLVLNKISQRVDRLVERMEKFRGASLKLNVPYRSDSASMRLFVAASYGYIFGFAVASYALISAALLTYTYADNPPVIPDTGVLLSSLYMILAGAFVLSMLSVCLIGSIIASQWNKIRKAETKFDAILSEMRIQELAPKNKDMSEAVIKVNANVLRWLGMGEGAGVQSSSPL